MRRLQIIILAVLACFAISNARPTTVHHTHNTRQTLKTEQGLFPDYPQYTSIYSEWDYLTVQQTAFYQQMAVTVFDATGTHILSTVVEETGKVPVKEYAKNLANAWSQSHKNGRYIFIFHFVDENYTYFEIGEGLKNIITEKTLDSLKTNIYEPKLKQDRIGEGILSIAHDFAEIIYLKQLNKPFNISKADIPEEGKHIYHKYEAPLFFLMFAGVLVIFTAAYKQKRKRRARAKQKRR